ncbi:site-specific recombinase XerD [Kribbella voronezhensis]|uniref:Site-specific recombinase XerD n=1 Tax=Kribbella voronezhensis TaxID=2512212 RepID=A0A4R7T8F7_9ACTN|nr:site-specific integrase [Kribbella voronezhensis]TDU87616.1 site-specific recombinase XerD [Kribbella voronezhensis]
MPQRRSQGDGGIHWDASKKRYIAVVYLGPPVGNAKRPRLTASATTKTEAKEKLKEKLKQAQDRAALAAKDYTVKEAVNDWFDFGLHKRHPRTVKNLRSLANKHVIPHAIGTQRLQELSADEVDEWLGEKAKSLSTDTLRRLHSILRRSITRAQAREKVHRNVVMLCEIPNGVGGRPSKSLTVGQAQALLEAAAASPLHAYIVVSIQTGARTEELRALTWANLDLDGRPNAEPPVPPSIRVWRSVREGGDTKTFKSRRTLELAVRCVDALKAHRERQDVRRQAAGSRWQHHDLVFATEIGTELDAANVRRAFRKVVREAGLDPTKWTPRELRHSFVSLLSSKGVRIEDISRLVGHASTTVTEKVYRHELRPVLTEGATKMDEIFPSQGDGEANEKP